MIPLTETIQTNHFLLRVLTPEIYRELFEICYDDEIMDYLGLENSVELEAEKEKYRQGISTYKISFVYFHILFEDRLIGNCGFHTWYTLHARAEIGYGIRKEEDRGKGVMSEIMPYLLRYGFETMNLNRIEAMVGTGNVASKKLLLHNGFRQEGLLQQHYLNNGTYEDSEVYGLLRGDWKH